MISNDAHERNAVAISFVRYVGHSVRIMEDAQKFAFSAGRRSVSMADVKLAIDAESLRSFVSPSGRKECTVNVHTLPQVPKGNAMVVVKDDVLDSSSRADKMDIDDAHDKSAPVSDVGKDAESTASSQFIDSSSSTERKAFSVPKTSPSIAFNLRAGSEES